MELLRTPRLLLRNWEESDLDAFFDLYSREDVIRWLGRHPRRALASEQEARERMRRWHDRERELGSPLGLWAIVPLASGIRQPVGTIPLLPLADDDGPTGLTEVGWHLHPDHQGKGLATEAAQAVLAAAAQAGVEQVLALTDLDNGRSHAVATRLGMDDEGITERWFGLTSRQFRKVLTPLRWRHGFGPDRRQLAVQGVLDRPDRRGQRLEPVQVEAEVRGVVVLRRGDRLAGRGREPIQPDPQERSGTRMRTVCASRERCPAGGLGLGDDRACRLADLGRERPRSRECPRSGERS